MAGPIYFQWQNQVLLETIYTSRERKLVDFLVYYKEIDLWKQYKYKRIEELTEDVKQYIADREKTTRDAYESYKKLQDYFLRGDVRTKYAAKYGITDEKDLDKIRSLHKAFTDYLPKIADVRKEKYFVTQQYVQWEAYIKKVSDDITSRKRRLAALLNQDTKAKETLELQKIENVILKVASDELLELRTFVSTYNKIEKRKLDLSKAKEAAQTGVKGARSKLDLVRTQLNTADANQRKLAAELHRIKTPPSLDAVKGYFSGDDVHARSAFPKADAVVIKTLTGLRQKLASDLLTIKDEAVQQVTVKNLIYPLQEQQRLVNREIAQVENELRVNAPTWEKRGERQGRLDGLREAAKAIDSELDKVEEYKSAVDYSKKTPVERAQLAQAKEKELLIAQQRSSQLGKDAADLEAQIRSFETLLNQSEEEYLIRYTPGQAITVKDILRNKTEAYAASIANKNQFELLELIVSRFVGEPERYPLWLQYMVIHFSGMRYASAHGSWADPKDLLSSLLTPKLEKRFKGYGDNEIEPLCEQRIALYEKTAALTADAPRLASATEPKWKEKIVQHLKGLKLLLPHQRRKAYYDLLLDEQEYEIEIMNPEEVLAEIKEIGAQENFPEWMWKEITRLTEMRIQEVNSKEWEKLTPAQQEQRNDAKYAEYRTIMNKWKEQNLTGWREEHDKSNRLIVTRSVCNEVAEQIQHLRGNSPPGGLTAKAPWYKNLESDWMKKGKPAGQESYLKKARTKEHYKVGASILWLRFVNELPNAWRVAEPLKTSEGDELIPMEYRNKKTPDDWTYSMGNVVTRVRTRVNEKKMQVKDTQWLRWIHEATVADIAETADGTYVLTFETALPYDDPRISTIGVFKRDINDLLHFDGGEEYYNGSFLGFTPEGKLPVEDLAEMLDWNKILLKQFMPPAQLEDYKNKHIRKM
jgi:hypothetical protein